MIRIQHVAMIVVATTLAGAEPALAQGGLLGRIKQKAADKVIEKATDRGKEQPADTTAKRGGMNTRRGKPLDPTVLESPGAGGAPSTWKGQGMTLDQFKTSIPELTEPRLATYLRARRAYLAEAERIAALRKSDVRAVRDLMECIGMGKEPPFKILAAMMIGSGAAVW